MEQEKKEQGQLSEKNKQFLEKWKKSREEFAKLPQEEQERIRNRAQELFDRATHNGLIE